MERNVQGSTNGVKRELCKAQKEIERLQKENEELLAEIEMLTAGVTGVAKGMILPQFLLCRKFRISKSTLRKWEKEGLRSSRKGTKLKFYDTDLLAEFMFDIQEE